MKDFADLLQKTICKLYPYFVYANFNKIKKSLLIVQTKQTYILVNAT